MKKIVMVMAISGVVGFSASAFAGGKNDDGHSHSHGHGEMMSENKSMMNKKNAADTQLGAEVREVNSSGRVNKIMADKGMLNIKHEPIPEMNWPKMNMNFSVTEGVDLSALKPGQMIDFVLSVDADNNYKVTQITAK